MQEPSLDFGRVRLCFFGGFGESWEIACPINAIMQAYCDMNVKGTGGSPMSASGMPVLATHEHPEVDGTNMSASKHMSSWSKLLV